MPDQDTQNQEFQEPINTRIEEVKEQLSSAELKERLDELKFGIDHEVTRLSKRQQK